MTVQAYILMTQDQRDTAEALNDVNARLGSQQIANTLAANLGFGAIVGQWVVAARVLNDPAYVRWVPTLGALPIHVMDSETLFAPPPPL